MLPSGTQSNAYTGAQASYVALSAVTVLALALLCSIWTTDVSGSIALLGLFAVYMASQELLVLFMVFTPGSILVDLMRGLGGPAGTSGRGWLIFLQLLEVVAKAAGGWFAFSLWRSVGQGEYAGPASSSYAAPPPPSVPIPGTSASSYQRVQDPFSGGPAAYSPPASHTPPPAHTQQPAPQPPPPPPMQAHAVAPVPAAPHHDLV